MEITRANFYLKPVMVVYPGDPALGDDVSSGEVYKIITT